MGEFIGHQPNTAHRTTPGGLEHRASSLVNNVPDVQPIEIMELPELSVADPTFKGYYDRPYEMVDVPVTIVPPVYPRVVSVGGGRSIGGGTSKEAIRTARKKERQAKARVKQANRK